jgi:glucoamylase
MYGYFMANVDIQDQGGVVASPDPNTPGGSYYYHWARDGALTMHTVLTCSPSSVDVKAKMDSYVGWVGRTHAAVDTLVDSRVEAKFLLPDATPYPGPWCRPQNDGPGLRAITLISYANQLLAEGNEDHVRKTLWSADSYSAIKYDLDWIADGGFNNATCDLWEEVRSNDFFWNKFTMRKALTLGAAFATKMNDPASASRYTNIANQLEPQIKNHYQNGFIYEDTNRQKDGAVICALNDGYNGDDVFSASSSEVANTINVFNQAFHAEYPINGVDDGNKIPGILYGRYPGDTYAGGNPWVLTSGCLAQLHFRAAAEIQAMDQLPAELEVAWRTTLSRMEKGNAVSNVKFERPADLAAALANEGDGILTRIRYHTVGAKLHQPEQLDKHTGVEISATDLTWSYATIFKAMNAKKDYLTML